VARIALLLPAVSEEELVVGGCSGDIELVDGMETLVVADLAGLKVLVTMVVLPGAAVTQTVLNTVLVSVTCDADSVATGSWSIGGTVEVSTSTIDGVGSGAFGLESIDIEIRKFSLSTSTYSPPPA
jgi:hypothetical protein